MTNISRRAMAGAGAAGLASAIAAPALAQSGKLRWRMVTSWPKRLPGPGMSAERVADRINKLSGGGSRSWCRPRAKWCRPSRCSMPSAPASPRWDTPPRLLAGQGAGDGILHHGAVRSVAERARFLGRRRGGQVLWDELYAPFGVKPFMAGNTGVCMGGLVSPRAQQPRRHARLKVRSLGLAAKSIAGLAPFRRRPRPARFWSRCNQE